MWPSSVQSLLGWEGGYATYVFGVDEFERERLLAVSTVLVLVGNKTRITNWSSTVETVWDSILRNGNKSVKLKPNQKGRGTNLRFKSIPPVRSPRNPHMWDQSKIHVLKGENGFSVQYKLKLRQNRRLQHLRVLLQKTHSISSELRNQEKDR